MSGRRRETLRGATTRWLFDHRDHPEVEDCLRWPFARSPDGRPHAHGEKPCRIMCRLVHGPAPSPQHEAAHSCGKGHEGCINPHHLKWATHAENMADLFVHGTANRPRRRLSKEEIIQVAALQGSMNQHVIAAKFGVSRPTITNALRNFGALR